MPYGKTEFIKITSVFIKNSPACHISKSAQKWLCIRSGGTVLNFVILKFFLKFLDNKIFSRLLFSYFFISNYI